MYEYTSQNGTKSTASQLFTRTRSVHRPAFSHPAPFSRVRLARGIEYGNIWDSPRCQDTCLKSETETWLFSKIRARDAAIPNFECRVPWTRKKWVQVFYSALQLSVPRLKINYDAAIHDNFTSRLQVSR